MYRKYCALLLATFSIHAGALDIQQWTTHNGANVLFMETHALPMVDVRVVFDAGSSRDDKQFGVAALTNALMPSGTAGKNEEQLTLAFENLGAVFGHESLRDMSLFSLRSLSEPKTLNAAIISFADILANPRFPKEVFARDKARILQHIEQEKQSPGVIASQAFMKALYKDHPYAHPSIGTKASVGALTPADLIAFHQRYFVGNNATVAIVGDLDLLQAKTLANQLVGTLPAGEKPKPLPSVKPLDIALQNTIDFPSSQTHILIGQPSLSRKDPDYFPLYVGNHILGGSGLVSRISNEIREKRGLAYSAYSYFSPMRAQGPFQIGTQTKNETSKEALQVLQQTVRDFIAQGPSAQELEQSKKNIVGGFALRTDSNKKIVEYLAVIGFYSLPKNYLDSFIDKVKHVTLEEIKQAWQQRITPDKMSVILVGKTNGKK